MLFFLSSCVKLINIGEQRPPPIKIITGVFLHDDVQLKKSENAWKPGRKRESLPAEPESQRTQVGPNIQKKHKAVATCRNYIYRHIFIINDKVYVIDDFQSIGNSSKNSVLNL